MASRYGLEIRAAAPADAPQLAETLAAAGRPVTPSDLAERLERLGREDGTALLALEWGPPSGVVVLHWHSPLSGPRTAHVSLLLVADEARRRGIGRLLLKAGSQAARTAGCHALVLPATPDATALAAFCASTGFEAAGQVWRRSLRKRG